jgi:hypothetical protein
MTNKIKKTIMLREGERCFLCGISKKESIKKHKKNLFVHHIDYDKKNSVPSNLVTLCIRCNSLVNFNRKVWTQFFDDRKKIISKEEHPLGQDNLRWVCVDWDNTIVNTTYDGVHYNINSIIGGAREALKKITEAGFKIIIYTARPWSDYIVIENYCLKNKLSFSRIICGKPLFKVCIDDRNIEFKGDWEEVLKSFFVSRRG